MEQELRYILTIIGAIVIGGVLIHGIWTVRKNGSKKTKRAKFKASSFEPGFEREDDLGGDSPIYDDVGVGKVRIVNETITPVSHDFDDLPEDLADIERPINHNNENEIDDVNIAESTEFATKDSDSSVKTANGLEALYAEDENTEIDANVHQKTTEDNESDAAIINENEAHLKIVDDQVAAPVYSNVVTQPKPEYTKAINARVEASREKTDDFGQPPGFLLKKKDEEEKSESAVNNIPEHGKNTNKQSNEDDDSDNKTVEPLDAASKAANKPAPDFSLNIQDGPLVPNKNKTSRSDTGEVKQGVEKELSFAEQAKRFVRRNKKTVAEKIRKEPTAKTKAAEDQMRIDFDADSISKTNDFEDSRKHIPDTEKSENNQSNNASEASHSQQTDVLVLNVRAENDKPISGAALLPMLLTLGFKFGEHDIFHRHVNTNGKGPVLFSLTNMFKPGVFDVDNMENFDTFGVSLFMMLPIEGDAQQVFNMMHNAARKISEEFGCRILDGNKVGLSKQSLQQYVERIREFERKRINR